jgi:hypothetical protein
VKFVAQLAKYCPLHKFALSFPLTGKQGAHSCEIAMSQACAISSKSTFCTVDDRI